MGTSHCNFSVYYLIHVIKFISIQDVLHNFRASVLSSK
jgi:hypothetical protein